MWIVVQRSRSSASPEPFYGMFCCCFIVCACKQCIAYNPPPTCFNLGLQSCELRSFRCEAAKSHNYDYAKPLWIVHIQLY